jgi:hypothetical protein
VTIILRLGLAAFAVVELFIGGWAAISPRSFYDGFPTVDLTPPFSEHLLRDFGGATLGIAVVLAAAAIWPTTRLATIALIAYLAFSAPHLVFHLEHLEGATTSQATFLVTVLVASVVVPVALLSLAFARHHKSASVPPEQSSDPKP